MLDIRVYCDICRQKVDDINDFACDLAVLETRISLIGESLVQTKERVKTVKQICKGCYYKHINKLFNEKKD